MRIIASTQLYIVTETRYGRTNFKLSLSSSYNYYCCFRGELVVVVVVVVVVYSLPRLLFSRFVNWNVHTHFWWFQ